MPLKTGPGDHDVIVLGGGVIGCAIAFFLAKRGVRPLLVERGQLGSEATQAASGVVLPHPGGETLDRLANESFRMFPTLVDELRDLSGIDPEYERTGRIDAALNEWEAASLKGSSNRYAQAGIRVEWLDGKAVREVEPLISPSVTGGLYVPESACVSGGLLAGAFAGAASALGAEVRSNLGEVSLVTSGGAVSGVRASHGMELAAETVVLAAGSWSGQIAASAGVGLGIVPVRGQNLRLRMPAGLRLSTNIYGDETILVPRPDGRTIAGVTIESVGFDSRATTEGIRSIMERSTELVPALADAVVEQAYAGLRPASADGLPVIGRPGGVGGLVVATAHYRMGIALSPVTGRLVADHIADGTELPHEFRPDRGINGG